MLRRSLLASLPLLVAAARAASAQPVRRVGSSPMAALSTPE